MRGSQSLGKPDAGTPPEEKKKRKREIENNPYDIFSKYGDRFR